MGVGDGTWIVERRGLGDVGLVVVVSAFVITNFVVGRFQ